MPIPPHFMGISPWQRIFSTGHHHYKGYSQPMPTIEQLENNYWGSEPSYDSYLVTTIYQLRQKRLEDFTTEDLRICIGQNQSLPILIPIALQVLQQNLLAEGHHYPGDLLKAVLCASPQFWQAHPLLKTTFIRIFRKKQQRIKHSVLCTPKEKAAFFELFKQHFIG